MNTCPIGIGNYLILKINNINPREALSLPIVIFKCITRLIYLLTCIFID
nr:MAG TPA: hypothetical protein [Caudoviricetes sp.]